MGGIFGVASKESCTFDLFYGIDYHSHLGTRRGGMAVIGPNGFNREIHNIENSPFRTKFEHDVPRMEGNIGIGCISDSEGQPLLIKSHLGSYAITTVGKINNTEELIQRAFRHEHAQFLEMSGGVVNTSELVSWLINEGSTIPEGIAHAQELIDGSMTLLVMTREGIYAARDRYGRTPLFIGAREGAHCISLEEFAYSNLEYHTVHELGPGEVDFVTPEAFQPMIAPRKEKKICSFLWVYYGYPTASYEGVGVEEMRYRNGANLARRDNVHPDIVAGVPDSGTAHAIGYANQSGCHFARPFVKYTPTWPRSFMPQTQTRRDLIARMKLIPVSTLVKDKSVLLIDDSLVRGTQVLGTLDQLHESGVREVHFRPACPPIMYGCKYLNFSRSKSELDMISRRTILQREGSEGSRPEVLAEYSNPDSERYEGMVEDIRKQLGFASLRYQRLDDMIDAIGLPECDLCTYCWNGKE
ncbi:MAG: amidophosphoribosyltransferase [Lachnospiraceae bacterium]|nr:amidophosphoribosyltransferase [Lachnospiraceae bacterium]